MDPQRLDDLHEMIESAREELEAIDVYLRRMAQTRDPRASKLWDHALREEVEHFAMFTAWIGHHLVGAADELEKWLAADQPPLQPEYP